MGALLGQTGELTPGSKISPEELNARRETVAMMIDAHELPADVKEKALAGVDGVKVAVEFVDTLRDENNIPVNAKRAGNTIYLLNSDREAALNQE